MSSRKHNFHLFIFSFQIFYLFFRLPNFLGTYAESQWGIANFTVPAEVPCVCAFNSQNNAQSVIGNLFSHFQTFFLNALFSPRKFDQIQPNFNAIIYRRYLNFSRRKKKILIFWKNFFLFLKKKNFFIFKKKILYFLSDFFMLS